jgi:hypothetical protein
MSRFADRTETTTSGRIVSFVYLFEKITDLSWWIPQGTLEFLKLHQVEPHCTPTLMFCDAGMLGLLSWIFLFFTPALSLIVAVIKGRAAGKTTMVGLAGIASVILQFSLPAHLDKQVWLWGGAVVASLVAERHRALTAEAAPADGISSLAHHRNDTSFRPPPWFGAGALRLRTKGAPHGSET